MKPPQHRGSHRSVLIFWIWLLCVSVRRDDSCPSTQCLWGENTAHNISEVKHEGMTMNEVHGCPLLCAKSFSGPQSSAGKTRWSKVMWWLLMDKESPIDENAWIREKLDSGGEALPTEWESKWTIEQRKWKSILGGGLKWSLVMKKQSRHEERESERARASASFS